MAQQRSPKGEQELLKSIKRKKKVEVERQYTDYTVEDYNGGVHNHRVHQRKCDT